MTLDLAALRLLSWQGPFDPCATCGQTTGHRCRTSSNALTVPHEPRLALARGYDARQPEVDALQQAIDLRDQAISAANDALRTAAENAATLTDQLKTARLGAALVPGLQQQVADLLAKVAALTTPAKPAPLFGFWAGTDTNGAGTSTRENFDRVSGYLGAPQVYRMFYGGMLPATFGGNVAFGPPVVVSFKAPPAEIVAGKHDATLLGFVSTKPKGLPIWLSYWHEPEDDIERGAFTAAEYRAAWEHIAGLVGGTPEVRLTLILMRYTLSKTSRKVADYVAKGLDVLAWDTYLTGNLTMADLIDKPKAVSDSFGLAFGIGECSTDQTAKLAGLARDLPAAATRAGAEFCCWFESNKSDGDWRMRRDPAAVGAWAAR